MGNGALAPILLCGDHCHEFDVVEADFPRATFEVTRRGLNAMWIGSTHTKVNENMTSEKLELEVDWS